jgi:pimeloyl-ACP methyl ester carboxylesterase
MRGSILGRIVRWTGLAWLLWRVFGPEPSPSFAPEQVRPLRIPGRTLFSGDRELFVREVGPAGAPPLVLVHGWSFDGEMTFFRIIPELAKDFRVIVPDHRNHGRSEWVRGTVEVEDLADDVAFIMRALDAHGATVFGYSLGGMVTQELVRRHPHLVGRVVLGATAARPVDGLIVRGAAKLAFFLGRGLARVSRAELAYLSMKVVEHSAGLEPRYRRWMWTSLLRRDASLFYEAGHAAWRFDSRPWVGGLDVPATVVVNGRDTVVLPARQRELAALLPAARVVELPNAGHESVLAQPERYVEIIREVAAR